MSLYGVGDIVRIRSDLRPGEAVPMCDGSQPCIVTTQKMALAGREVVIRKIFRDTGRYEIDLHGYYGVPWTDGMFEPAREYEIPPEADILSLLGR